MQQKLWEQIKLAADQFEPGLWVCEDSILSP